MLKILINILVFLAVSFAAITMDLSEAESSSNEIVIPIADGDWEKKHAKFDLPKEAIDYVTRESFILYRVNNSVLEVNFHDLYLRGENWKDKLLNNYIGSRYTPLLLLVSNKLMKRIFHILVESQIIIESTWTLPFLMDNWQIFDKCAPEIEDEQVLNFKQLFPEVKKIYISGLPKNSDSSHLNRMTGMDISHPLVISTLKPAEELSTFILMLQEYGIEMEFFNVD